MFLRLKPAIERKLHLPETISLRKGELSKTEFEIFLKLPLFSRVWQMRFDVEVRLFLAMRSRLAVSLEIDDGNEEPGIDWLRLNLVSWREPIGQLRQRRVEHESA
jgi:hypothetical protein